PVVALDVNPGRGCRGDHAHSVKVIAADKPAGGSLFDVDILGGGGRDIVVDDFVVVAAIGLAGGVPAPVLVRRPDVDPFAEELHQQPGVPDHAVADRVVAAERAQVNRFV